MEWSRVFLTFKKKIPSSNEGIGISTASDKSGILRGTKQSLARELIRMLPMGIAVH